jgi:hypothetical protein
MQSFVHDQNIALYRKLIAESESNPSRDEDRHAMLLTLLAEEIAKAPREEIAKADSQMLDGDADYRRRPSLWS